MSSENIKVFAKTANESDLRKACLPRDLYGNKGTNGRVMIIGGSAEYHGAPSLASNAVCNMLAALRVGTGYAYLYAPKAIESTVRHLSPNIITRRFGADYISEGDIGEIKKEIERTDAIAIGMGIGRSKSTLKMAARIIDLTCKMNKKMVIDADAIYAIKYVKRLGKNVILTPQDNEFYELSGLRIKPKDLKRRISAASTLSRRLGSNILLKGHSTVISDGKRTKIIMTKTSALATMGTGDVLSGIICGFAAIGNDAFEAAVAGAYLHDLIGDKLSKEKGNHILAVDVVDFIPKILKKFDR